MTNAQLLAELMPEPSPSEQSENYDGPSFEARVNAAFPEVPRTSDNFFSRRAQDIMRGVSQLGQAAGGLGMLAKIPGSEGLYLESSRMGVRNAPLVGSYRDIGSVSDGLEYLTSSIFEQLPLFAVTLPSGVGGMALAARAAGAPVSQEIGLLTARGIAKEYIEKFGLEEAAKKIAIRKELGALTGSWASSSAIETGSIAGDIHDQTGGKGMESALLFGPIAGGFDAIPNVNLIKNILGRPVAEKVVKYAAERVGTETAKQSFMGAGTEGVQTIIERLAVKVADPNYGVFTDDGWKDIIDSTLKGGFGSGVTGGAGEVFNRNGLKPSADIQENAAETDIESKISAISDDGQQEAAEVPPEAQQEAPDELVIANNKLGEINKELDAELLKPEPDQEYVRTLNEERKKAQEEIRLIQSKRSGYDPNKKGGYMRFKKKAPMLFENHPEIQAELSKEWMNKLDSEMGKGVKPEAGMGGVVKKVKDAYRKALSPLALLMQQEGVGINLRQVEDAISNPTDEELRPSISYSDNGDLTLNIPQPERLRQAKGEGIDAHIESRLPAQLREEADHVIALAALRNQWREEGGKQTFKEFMAKKTQRYADSIRRASSNKTLEAFSIAYSGGRRVTDFTIPTNATPEQAAQIDQRLANEFIRAVFRKMRDGTITEELHALEVMESQGNAEAGSFLNTILDAIQTLKNAIVSFINPKTAPKEIKELLDQMNAIADKYEGRKKASPVNRPAPRSAPSTLPEQQEPTTANVAQARAMPEPPVEEGMVRLYHGGVADRAGSDFTPSREYAEGYAAKSRGGKVFYVDVPKDAEFLRRDEGAGNALINRQILPDEIADQAQPLAPIANNKIYSGDDITAEWIQYFETRNRYNEVELSSVPIRAAALEHENPEDKIRETRKYRNLAAQYPGKVFPLGGPNLVRTEGASIDPERVASLRAEINGLQSGEDIVPGFANGLANSLGAESSGMPDNTGKPRNTEKTEFYVGLNNIRVDEATRSKKEAVKKAAAYIAKNGMEESLRRAANNNLGTMYGPDKMALRGVLLNASPYYMEAVRNSSLPVSTKIAALTEALANTARLRDSMAVHVTETARELESLKWVKTYMSGGESGVHDYRRMVMNEVYKKENGLSKEEMAAIHEAIMPEVMKGIDQIFTRGEFLKKIEQLFERASQNPKALFKKVKESLKTSRAFARRVASESAFRAGLEIQNEDGNQHVTNVARKIAAMLDMSSPIGKQNPDFLTQALTRFAKDNLDIKPVANPRIKDANMRILHAIIANNKTKNRFVDALESEITKLYKSPNAPGAVAAKETLAQMRQDGWSEGIRDAAIKELQRNMGVTIEKMIRNGWSDSKEEMVAAVEKAMAGVADRAIVERLVDDVNAALDRQATEHLENTFGFKRKPNGEFELTKKGGIKGGKGIREILSDKATSLRDLTKLSYAAQDQFIDGNVQSWIDGLGLPEDMARDLQEAFAKEFRDAIKFTQESEVSKKVEAILSKLSDTKKIPAYKNVIDSLVEMANQGFLGNETIYNAIRENYKDSKLPPFNPEIAQMIRELGDEMDRLPEGVGRDAMRQVIANELANQSGINWKDALTGYWYFSLLSGPSTFGLVNPVYNAFALILDSASMAADAASQGHPERARQITSAVMGAFNSNSAAWQRFLYTLKTGNAPVEISSKFGMNKGSHGNVVEMAQMPMERITEEMAKGGKWWQKAFYRLSRGFKIGDIEFSGRSLIRFMAATDIFFRTASRDAALAYQGIGVTEGMRQRALEQAKAELPLESQEMQSVRADEIVLNELAKEGMAYQVARAEQIGLITVAAGAKRGAIGKLAEFLGNLSNKYAAVRVLVPFTNIVAGVWNNSLDYSPVGLLRYFAGGKEFEIDGPDGMPIKDRLLFSKAMIGTAVMALAAMLFGDEDDNAFMSIYGAGPKDPGDRRAFFAQGKKPFSIRVGNQLINYQFLGPLSAVLGGLGTWRDLQRDWDKKKFDANWLNTGADLIASTVAGVLSTQMNQSFLSSLTNAAEAIYSNDPGKGLSKWAANLAGTAMPNIIRQLVNEVIWPEKYQSSEFLGQLAISLAVTKNIGTEKALNEFGQPVSRRELPVIGRITSTLDPGAQIIADIDRLGLRYPSVSYQLGGERMTDKQKSDFTKIAGPMRQARLAQIMPALQRLVSSGKTQDAQDLLEETYSTINRAARQKLLKNP